MYEACYQSITTHYDRREMEQYIYENCLDWVGSTINFKFTFQISKRLTASFKHLHFIHKLDLFKSTSVFTTRHHLLFFFLTLNCCCKIYALLSIWFLFKFYKYFINSILLFLMKNMMVIMADITEPGTVHSP